MGKSIEGIFPNGLRNKYFGGVFPSVLALLLIFSLIFSQHLNSYRNEAILYQQTKQMYLGKTVERMTLGKLKKRYSGCSELVSGKDCYNIGTVIYEMGNQQVNLEVILDSGLSYEVTVSAANW